MSSPGTSSGLHDTIRTNGAPAVSSAGKRDHVVLDDDVGPGAARISRSCGSQYRAPSTSACQVGWMNVSSCSRVGLRNSGAVSRMKSFQNRPASCSSGPSGRLGRGQVDQVLLEAERRQPAAPRRLGREHHPVAAAAQHVAEADALVGRPVGRLGHEQDGQGRGHSGRRLRRAGERSWSPPAATGHPAGRAGRLARPGPAGPVGPRPAGPAGAGAPR